MATKVRAMALGMEYQHRFFWIQACRLFNGDNVAHVAIEQPRIRAFDDVVTTYRTPILDPFGQPVVADHFQLKFHLTQRAVIRASDLITPGFIGATTFSLLDRVRDAFAGGDVPRRLTLVTCWDIDTSDPLGQIVSSRAGEVEVDRLLKAGPRSAIGRMRELWRSSLGGITDEHLGRMLRHLRFQVHHLSEDLDELLERDLLIAGLAPVDRTMADHPYLAVSQRFVLDDQREHDAGSLDAVLQRENLRLREPVATANRGRELAIKSFGRFAVELEDTADTLNLLSLFSGRRTAEEVEWNRDLTPRVVDFLVQRIRAGGSYVLHLDTHLSLAYLAGVILGKVPATVFPARARKVWRPSASVAAAAWEIADESLGEGPELALAIEVARPIAEDVRAFLRTHAPAVGKLLILRVPGGAADNSITDADHGLALARGVTAALQARRTDQDRGRPLHLFIAAPAPFVFFLGAEGRAFGPTVTHEFDFESGAPGAYSAALDIQPREIGGSK